jgi:hypothetical protein
VARMFIATIDDMFADIDTLTSPGGGDPTDRLTVTCRKHNKRMGAPEAGDDFNMTKYFYASNKVAAMLDSVFETLLVTSYQSDKPGTYHGCTQIPFCFSFPWV